MIPKSQLISLSEVPGMGPRRIRALLRKFTELEDITNLPKSDMMQVELLPELNCEGKLIFQQVSKNPIHIGALCIQLKKDIPEMLSNLLMLELKNIVQQHPGILFTESI